MKATALVLLATLPFWAAAPAPAGSSDESVFVQNLRPDQHESLLYVWTSDADGKDPDFVTVIDADPKSPTYATVIATAATSAGGNEAHHFGYTADAGRIFAGGLFSNRLFIYDVKTDPRHPRLGDDRLFGPAHVLRGARRRPGRDAGQQGRRRPGRGGQAR